MFKKRLDDNLHRSIVLANAVKYWMFAYLLGPCRDQSEGCRLLAATKTDKQSH
nr:hypothetical protein [Ensifer adhaerens]